MKIGDYDFVNYDISAYTADDVAYLNAVLLDETGRLKVLPAKDYAAIPLEHLRVWASLNSRYGFLTTELIEWLQNRITGRKAIEIAAGNGDLGHRLSIPMTDSYQQVEDVETVFYLSTLGITPTKPHPSVEKEDGENAVRRRKPQVVVACYATEKYQPRPGEFNPKGNYKGIRYDYIIERCDTFILIGNKTTHGANRALKYPHEELSFPWLVSRSKNQSMNRIWVWEKKR